MPEPIKNEASVNQVVDSCTLPLWKRVLEFFGVDLSPKTKEPKYVPVTEADKQAYAEDKALIKKCCKH